MHVMQIPTVGKKGIETIDKLYMHIVQCNNAYKAVLGNGSKGKGDNIVHELCFKVPM